MEDDYEAEDEGNDKLFDFHYEAKPGNPNDNDADWRFMVWYEDICRERMALLAACEDCNQQINEYKRSEKGYRKRINELKDNIAQLVKAFGEAQSEVEVVRQKYEPKNAENIHVDSYKVVCQERDRLINAESEYKMKIIKLESEVEMLSSNNNTQKEVVSKTSINKLVVITSTERQQELEKENSMLRYNLERLERTHKLLGNDIQPTKANTNSVQSIPVKRDLHVKKAHEKPRMNKKSIPTVLPLLQCPSSGSISGDVPSTSISSISRTTQARSTMHRLSYGDIHIKRQLQRGQSDTGSVSSNQYRRSSNT